MPKALRIILNIIFIPILFTSIAILLVSYGLSSSLSNKNIKKTVTVTIKNNISKSDAEDSILNSIYHTADSYGIKKEFVDEALSSDKVQTLISEYVYYTAIDIETELKRDYLDKLVDDAIDDITKDLPFFSNAIKEELKIDLYNKYKEQRNNVIKTEVASGEVDAMTFFTKMIKFIKNTKLRISLFISLIISLLVLCLLNLKNFVFMKIISITSLVSSLSIFGISRLLILISKTEENIEPIVRLLISPLTKLSLIMTLISLVILIIYIVIVHKIKKD